MNINPTVINNGVVFYLPKDRFGYFAWPSIARQDDGTLLLVASGFRAAHICPWGKTVIFRSSDNGETWSYPQIINDTPLDDRDPGIISLGGQRVAITWFTSNTSSYHKPDPTSGWPEERREEGAVLDTWELPMCSRNIGSWLRVSPDGYYWGETSQVPVNTPHGFIILKDGSWLYFGKRWDIDRATASYIAGAPIVAVRSTDEGRTWEMLGSVPAASDCSYAWMHEPHVLELKDGGLLGAIRISRPQSHFQLALTRSQDGGRTWSTAEECGMPGSPPHLLRHSSGAIVMVYSYRVKPYGQRARVSCDEGATWSEEIPLRTDGYLPSIDLGYPASVELPGGEILTIYYQTLAPGDRPGIMYTKWKLT